MIRGSGRVAFFERKAIDPANASWTIPVDIDKLAAIEAVETTSSRAQDLLRHHPSGYRLYQWLQRLSHHTTA